MLFLLPLLIIAILLEGIITPLPLVLVCLLCLTIFKRDPGVFPVAFLAGLFLDVLALHRIGSSSIFFLIFVLLILLYQRKYEINSYPFVAVASFVGSIVFLGIFGRGNVVGDALVSSMLAVVLFMILRVLAKKFSI